MPGTARFTEHLIICKKINPEGYTVQYTGRLPIQMKKCPQSCHLLQSIIQRFPTRLGYLYRRFLFTWLCQ